MSQPISVQDRRRAKEAEKHTPSRRSRLVFMFGKYAFGNEYFREKYPEILDKRVCRVVHLQYPGRHLMPRNVKATN